ncbi:MAG: AAA family ATPase [Gammaproteobacteria bacterium]|nr:AAA family ATPase [Gammaproteobacteria bacterium]
MYESFYSLSSDPFRLLPDPGIFFPHRSSSRAWAYLRYALKRGEGIVVVTGQPGTGKTTLSERLLRESNPSKTVAVRLVAAELSASDLLRKLAYAMGLTVEGKDRSMLSLMLERHMYDIERSQRRVLIVIDEAQTLSHQSLEAMRLLTDLQAQGKPVVQLILFGQEELEGVMCTPGMEQFQQRVIAGCRLEPMSLSETKSYLEYRLTASSWRGDPSVNGPAVLAIHRFSRGIPRHVNKICSRLFLHASSEEKHVLTDRDVRTVVGDLRSELLAPADDDLPLKDAGSAGVFDSVYELALVPSAAPQPSSIASAETAEPAALADPAPLAASVEPDSAADRVNARSIVSRSRSGRGRDRRRSASRVLRETTRQVQKALNGGLALAGELKQKLPAIPAMLASARGRAGEAAGRLQSAAGQRWPAAAQSIERALRGSPVGGTATTVAIGVTGVIAIVAAISLTAVGEQVAEADDPGLLLASDASMQSIDVEHVLDGTSYIGADQSAAVGAHQVHRVEFALADTGLDAVPQQDTEIQAESTSADDAARLVGGQVAPIGLKIASGVVDGLSRYDSSMGIYAVAMEREVMRGDVTSDASAIDVTDVDESPNAPSNVVELPAPAVETASVATPDPIVAATAAETDNESEMTIVVTHDSVSRLDLIRFLPATAAGSRGGPAVEVAPEPIVEQALPEVVGAGVEIVDDREPSPAEAAAVEVVTEVPATRVASLDSSDPEVEAAESDNAARDAEIASLLQKASAALDADRLLMPATRSAYAYYRKVLKLDAENSAAASGMAAIVGRYAALAHDALGKQQFDRAERFVSRGLRVDAADARMRSLRTELETARAEAEAVALAEAEMARMAAEAKVEVIEVEVAPKRKPSNFQRIMNLATGL